MRFIRYAPVWMALALVVSGCNLGRATPEAAYTIEAEQITPNAADLQAVVPTEEPTGLIGGYPPEDVKLYWMGTMTIRQVDAREPTTGAPCNVSAAVMTVNIGT